MQFNRTVRQTLIDIITEYRRFLPVTLYEGDEYTVPGGDLEGTLFDTVAVQHDKIVLTSHEGSYAIPIDEAPVPASALAAVARLLVRKEWDAVGKALLDPRCDRDLCAIDAEHITRLLNENYLWLDPNRACERQVFECLLALGGPQSADSLLNDGCGDLYLGVDPDDHPTVFTGNANAEQFNADEISWVAERSAISLTLRESASGREARFVVLPDTLHGIRNHPDAPKAQGLCGVRKLERFLYRALLDDKRKTREEYRHLAAEQEFNGPLYVLAIIDIILHRGSGHHCHSFKRSTYDYQADIPHITAWWGGPAAIDTVYLNPIFQDAIGICCFPLCGLSHNKFYRGDEAGVPWERLFSEVYSQLQDAEDPDWEEWLETNRTRLVNEELSRMLYEGVTLPEDGIPAECLLPRPFTPYATLQNAYIAGPDDENFPEGTPVFGVDLGGQLLCLTPDDLDFNELYGLWLLIRDAHPQTFEN